MDILFNRDELTTLMNDFYTLSHIKMVLFDADFNGILAVPEQESMLCAAVRKSRSGKEKCDYCTIAAGKLCKELGGVNIYKCHLGLVEAVAPIKIENVIVGYMMFGQIIEEEDETGNRSEIIANAKHYGVLHAEKILDERMIKNQMQIHAAAKLMETCISYILMRNLIRLDDGGLPFILAKYIEDHLRKDLSAEAMCRNFAISRNMLYRISNKHFGLPIAAYIRKKRMDQAFALLKLGMAVTETADTVGFSDYSYFTKVFKREKGLLPSQVKRESLFV